MATQERFGRPLVDSLELVVQNAAAYQALLDRLEEAETLLALEEAAEEIERGEGSPATEALRLRRRLGVRERKQ